MRQTTDTAKQGRSSRFGAMLAGPAAAMLSVFAASACAEEQKEDATMISLIVEGPQGKLATYRIEGGEELPILFLHGDASRASHWDEVMQRTSAGRKTVSFDFRGHGASDPAANGDYSFDGRAADVGAVSDAFGYGRFIVVAHSGGAAVALAYGAKNPDRVAGLLLVDPPADPRALPQDVRDGFVRDLAGPNSLDALKAYYTSIAGPDAAVRDRVLKDSEAVDPAALAGVGRALAEWNPVPALDAYRGPLLILSTPITDGPSALYRLRTGIQHRLMEGVGHWPHLDRPEAVADAVNEFVAEVERE